MAVPNAEAVIVAVSHLERDARALADGQRLGEVDWEGEEDIDLENATDCVRE